MKRIGIIGAGSFGQALVESLAQKGVEVLLIDQGLDRVETFADYITKAVQGDATNLKTLKEAGFDECDIVVVTIGENLQASILATINCKELGVKTIISKAISDTHGKILKRVGADLVVFPNRDRAQRLAKSLVNARDYHMESIEVADGLSIVEIPPPPGLVGKTIREAAVRQSYHITILAIRRVQADPHLPRVVILVTGAETVHADDFLIVFGEDIHLAELGGK